MLVEVVARIVIVVVYPRGVVEVDALEQLCESGGVLERPWIVEYAHEELIASCAILRHDR